MMKAFYENCKCQIKFEAEESGAFETLTGVKQGDVLSFLLFALVIDFKIR